jgi:hypothetical protein
VPELVAWLEGLHEFLYAQDYFSHDSPPELGMYYLWAMQPAIKTI